MKSIGIVLTACMLLIGGVSCQQDRGDQRRDVAENDMASNENFTDEPVVNVDVTDTEDRGPTPQQRWTRDEFIASTVERGVFSNWDTDRDNKYSQDEITQGYFRHLDRDDNGFLTEEEFKAAGSAWGNKSAIRFEEWDMNNDDRLDRSEFFSGIVDSGLYDQWDANNDGVLSQDELNNAFFDTWDTDRDDHISPDEYNQSGFERRNN